MAAPEELQNAYDQGYTTGRTDAQNDGPGRLITQEFEQLRLELRQQGVCQNIRTFSGEGSEKFQNWATDIERARTQLNASDERSRVLALQTLSGPAADFCTREIQENPQITWVTLKKKLSNRYNDMADLQYARQKLRRMVQTRGESVQNYYERIMTVAASAFGLAERKDRHVQQQLIEYFVDGLRDDNMVRKLIRQKPETLERALEMATNEQQTNKSFDLRRGQAKDAPTPMEVGVVEHFKDSRVVSQPGGGSKPDSQCMQC